VTEQKNSIKALWLCSWFPDKEQEQNGDFIQRHAYATSLHANVTTIHVAPCSPSKMGTTNIAVETTTSAHLDEHILYYKKRKNTLPHRLKSVCQYFFQYRKWLRQHFRQNDLPDIVHAHITWRDGLIALWIKRKYQIPYVLTEQWTIYMNDGDAGFNHFNIVQRMLMRKILRNASLVLPVSTQLGEQLKTLFHIDYKPIGNVVDTSIFQYLPLEKRYEIFTFIHISDGSKKKNVEGLLETFVEFHNQYPTSRLQIVGLHPNLPIVHQYKNQNGIDFIPNIPYADVGQKLAQSHATIVNSLYETFSCVIIESLSCGVPVISTNIGVAPDIIKNNNGIIVETNNASLLSAMKEMYNNYNTYLANQNPIHIQYSYNYKKIGADINEVYSNIIQSKK